jgi:hypothetical protein
VRARKKGSSNFLEGKTNNREWQVRVAQVSLRVEVGEGCHAEGIHLVVVDERELPPARQRGGARCDQQRPQKHKA